MRDLLIIASLVLGSSLAAFRPFVGVLFWCWVSYMNPHRMTWNVAYNFPAAQVIGLGTLIGLVFTKERRRLPWEFETVLLGLLWVLFLVSTLFALVPSDAWPRLDQVSKILLMTLVTIVLVTSRQRLRWLLLTISLSVGFYGFKGGIFTILTGGHYRIYGPSGSFFEDNNDLALAGLMVAPLLFCLAREFPKKWLRLLVASTGVLTIISIIFTYSRGGLVGLVAVGTVALLRSKRKMLAAILLVIVLGVGTSLIPEQWFARMGTIGSGDASAMGRINAWYFAWNLALVRPLTGGGFETFNPLLFLRFAPDPNDFHAAHSIYLQTLGEQGFTGLGLFLGLLGSAILSLDGLRRRYRKSSNRWIADYAQALQLGLVGYATSGAFLGRAYFDLFYHLIASTIVLKSLARSTPRTDPIDRARDPDPGAEPIDPFGELPRP